MRKIEVFEIADSMAFPINREKCVNWSLLDEILRNTGRLFKECREGGLA
jgi:hypothetical protein